MGKDLGNKNVNLLKIRKRKLEDGQQLVSARDLHEFLGIGRDFTTWFKNRIAKYGFLENEDYIVIWSDTKSGGDVNFTGNANQMVALGCSIDYALTIDMSKELSMVENNEKGQQARKYFIACEKKLKEVTLKSLPQDYLTALKALVKSEEEKALMQPQVEYYQKVLNPDSDASFTKFVTMTAIAKDLQMSAQKLNGALNVLGIIYKQGKTWCFYKEYEDRVPEYADYFITEFGQTLKFTEKGREWIIKLLEKNK